MHETCHERTVFLLDWLVESNGRPLYGQRFSQKEDKAQTERWRFMDCCARVGVGGLGAVKTVSAGYEVERHP